MINSTRFNKGVKDLISEAGLPVSDLNEDNRFHYFCYGDPVTPDGVIILEILGKYGLLRSLCVRETIRGKGVGEALVAHLEIRAADLGISRLYLLTTDAVRYFKGHKYSKMDRTEAPEEIQNCTQFRELCPSGSVLMKKSLA